MIPEDDDIESYLWANDVIDSAEELTEDFRVYLWNGRIHMRERGNVE